MIRKIFYILLLSIVLTGCGSNISEKDKIMMNPNKVSAQEYYDNVITHSVIKDSVGHTLIFHEVGERGWRNYAFSIEHSPECELCCKIFD